MFNKKEINDHLYPRLKKESYLHRIKLRDYVINFSHNILEEENVLDFGCGAKPYRKFFKSKQYFGIDGSLTSKADIVSLDDLPVKNNSMDYVVSFQVLEHVPNPHKVISELYRVLKPNGTILISVPFFGDYHTCPNDYWRFTHEGVQELLKDFTAINITRDLSRVQCLIDILTHFIRSKTQCKKRKWLGHLCIIPLNLLGLCFQSSNFEYKAGLITSNFIATAKKPNHTT